MKKFLIAAILLGVCGVAVADPEPTVPAVVEATTEVSVSAFQRYAVAPVQFLHRFSWGVLTMAYKVGKAPVDAGFKIIGQTLGTEPNEPLWQ